MLRRSLLSLLLMACAASSGCALAIAQDLPSILRDPVPEAPKELGPGDHDRTLVVDGRERTFIVHVPPSYDKAKPTPLVLAFHGLGLPVSMMPSYTNLNETADKHGFIVVYPAGIALSWNAGARKGPLAEGRADDVKFTSEMLDDLERVLNIDKRRVYAAGMSNGAMLCYRLANELSHRIAAIAPVSGTMTYTKITSKRAVPIIHFHGDADGVVHFDRKREVLAGRFLIESAPDTIAAWVKFNGCTAEPVETTLPDKTADETTVVKTEYTGGRDGSEVILYTIKGGGHTWPGVKPPAEPISERFLGATTYDISANDLMWEFFEKHPMPEGVIKDAPQQQPNPLERSL